MEDKYLLPDWKDKNKIEKVFSAISIALAIIVIITIIISMVTKHNLFYLYYSFIVTFLIIQGMLYWKYNKPMAIIDFICSILFLITEIIMFVK